MPATLSAQVAWEEVRQMWRKGEPRLLMIVGGSGSGKECGDAQAWYADQANRRVQELTPKK